MRLIVASNNANKLREFREILGEQFDIVSMREAGIDADIEENGTTFEENALIKANYVMNAGNSAAIADDSGLEVDALGGAPGVYSARYAGEDATDDDRIAKLLSELQDVPEGRRGAHFVSAICCAFPDGSELCAEGICNGVIGHEKQGENGFGYDPLFYYEPLKKTFAQLTPEEKNSVSHRRRALESLCDKLRAEK